MAIMMEYMFFDFSIFGLGRKVSSLKDPLAVLHSECMFNSFESFPVFISKEVISAISYLHSRGIAHQDLKTLNVIVSIQHYLDLHGSTKHEISGKRPIACKLIDFGESRSEISTSGFEDIECNCF